MRDLQRAGRFDILVSMTSLNENLPGRWRLQDAKARFSELVRRARSDGPQHVTVQGRDEVVVVARRNFSPKRRSHRRGIGRGDAGLALSRD